MYSLKSKIVLICSLLIFSFIQLQAQQTDIQILSAVVKDKVIAGAQVIFQKNGHTSVTAYSDRNGKVNIPMPFDAQNDRNIIIIIKKEGYSTLVSKGPYNNLTYAISPVMQTLDGMRVVLSWGKRPLDLDSHLIYRNNHIYFEAKDGTNAHLDVDDTNSYGPETITIVKKKHGESYVYAVHDFSNKANMNSNRLAQYSDARVFVYIGSSLVKTYNVPQNIKNGNLWVVFKIDEASVIKDINALVSVKFDELDRFIERVRVTDELAFFQADRNVNASKQWNRKGETAYHSNDLVLALDFFRKAVESDPLNGQAYSNMGLTFQKLNREAEAIWANRKAIELASGRYANVTRANSYYNIARIYEKRSQYHDALNYYKRANENNTKSAYTNGINRVKAKM
ncbi:MAG: hypothetical protein OIF50_12675 [Flavobacteriaceae bacterium]|nr:hypothetical protein [Flavobacteriaceae bacterium]